MSDHREHRSSLTVRIVEGLDGQLEAVLIPEPTPLPNETVVQLVAAAIAACADALLKISGMESPFEELASGDSRLRPRD